MSSDNRMCIVTALGHTLVTEGGNTVHVFESYFLETGQQTTLIARCQLYQSGELAFQWSHLPMSLRVVDSVLRGVAFLKRNLLENTGTL